MSTKLEAVAAIAKLRPFVGSAQLQVMADCMRGEEKQFFFDKAVEIAAIIDGMPKTYQQDGKGDDAIVSLHYYIGGADWYITERDIDLDGDGQIQAFGLADLFNDGGELGYISIVELLENGAELDFHFKPRPLGAVRLQRNRVTA